MMLRKTSRLPLTVGKWVSQLMVSVGATLIATVVYSALPRATVLQIQPAPELTSGGKFAARAIPAFTPQAYDGLDTMPLPRMDAPVQFVAFMPPALMPPASATSAPAPSASATSASSLGPSTPERVTRAARPQHPSPRAEARHAPPPAPEPVRTLPPVSVEADVPSNDGWMPRVISTVHAAWSVTASAGDALVARVVPQIP